MTSWSPAAPLITSTPQSDAPEAASAIQGGTPRAVRLSLPGGPPVDAFALAGESASCSLLATEYLWGSVGP